MRPAVPGIRAVGWSLRCYPAWWRERYGAEQEELAEELAREGRRPWLLAAGLLAGSARARLTGSGMPPVPALWSSRTRVWVVASTVPAALVLPAEFAFVSAVSEHGWSDGAGVTLSGAGTAVHSELTILLLIWLGCVAQLLAAGTHLAAKLLALTSGRRLKAAAFVAFPIAAVALGILMIVISSSLRPVVSGWDKNLVTGVTHYYYLRRGSPLAAAALQWGGWAVAAGGWAVGLLALGRATAHSNLSARALQVAVSNARMTALTQGSFALGLIALEVTMAAQAPVGPHGGQIYASRLGFLAVPVLVILAAIAALSVAGAASAQTASARWRRLRSEPGTS
jgi:hypothetical protein